MGRLKGGAVTAADGTPANQLGSLTDNATEGDILLQSSEWIRLDFRFQPAKCLYNQLYVLIAATYNKPQMCNLNTPLKVNLTTIYRLKTDKGHVILLQVKFEATICL